MVDSKENAIREILKLDNRLKRKRPFSESKLTVEEFNRKYWLNGSCPYQYHTMSVEDGTNEREQLMINDIRSLKNSLTNLLRIMARGLQEQSDENKKEIAHIRAIIKLICAVQFGMLAVTSIRQIQHYLPKIHNWK